MPGVRARLTSPWRITVAALAAIVALTGIAAAVHLRHRPGERSPSVPDQSRPGPILLVPGYGGKKKALDALAARIGAATGRDATVLSLLGNGTGDLVAEARLLNGAIAARMRAGAPSVDLIGYSAGGVVVRILFDEFATARDVRRVVTMGSPFHGTDVATFAAVFATTDCPTACKQLSPVNDLIKDLGDRPLPAGLPWLSIWSENDTTVTPPSSARLTGAVNVPAQSVCGSEHITHSGLPTDPLVDGLVLRALGTGPITMPHRSDCAALRTAGR